MKQKFFDPIINFMAFLAGTALVAAVVIVCFEICMRYFFHRPQIWTVEVCEYILFGMTFLGAPWLLKTGGHVNIDVVMSQFGARGQAGFKLFYSGMGILTCLIISWFSIATAIECYESSVLIIKALSLPKHYFIILMAVSYFLLFVEFTGTFLDSLKQIRKDI